MKSFLLLIISLALPLNAGEWLNPPDGYTFARLAPSETGPTAGFVLRARFTNPDIASVKFYKDGVIAEGVRDGTRFIDGEPRTRLTDSGTFVFTAIAKDLAGNIVESLPPLTVHAVDPRPEPDFAVNPPVFGNGYSHVSGTITRFGSQIDSPVLEFGTSLAFGTSLPLRYGSNALLWNNDSSQWLMSLLTLAPDTVYYYRISYQTVDGLKHSPVFDFRTPLNTPPPQVNQSELLGTTNQVSLFLGNDLDGHPVSIVSTSALQHGTLNGNVYTAGPNFPGSETFTITTTDGYEQTTSSIRIATSEWYRASCFGNFESFLVTDTERPAGKTSVSVRPDGTFTGKFTYFGAPYSFKGTISAQVGDWPIADIEISRYDNEPFLLRLYVNPDPYGGDRLGLVLSIDVTRGHSLYGTWAGPSSPPPPEQIGQTNMLIPAEVGAIPAERPQGTGFAVMKVARKGAVRWLGRSGDNQPFSAGAKYNASSSVNVFARVSHSSTERIYGILREDGQSTLQWYKPERHSGAYSSGFVSYLQPILSRFEPYGSAEAMFDTSTEVAPALEFKAYDHAGDVVTLQNLQPGAKLDSGKETPGRVKLKINRKTGLFTGEIGRSTTNPNREKVSGVILPNARMGSGVWRKSGSDAKVILSPVSE